jgi:hypothetical protein
MIRGVEPTRTGCQTMVLYFSTISAVFRKVWFNQYLKAARECIGFIIGVMGFSDYVIILT